MTVLPRPVDSRFRQQCDCTHWHEIVVLGRGTTYRRLAGRRTVTWDVRFESLWITPLIAAEDYLESRVYNVADLVHWKGVPGEQA